MTMAEQTIDTVTTPVTLTDVAAAEVKALIAEQDRSDLYLRVYVAGGGCSGLQYGMALDEAVEADDETFTVLDIPMVIDKVSLKYMVGSVVDFVTTENGGGFKIENPNAVKSCGCGSSFGTEDAEAGSLDTSAGGGGGSCGCH